MKQNAIVAILMLIMSVATALANTELSCEQLNKQVVSGTCPADTKTIYVYYNTNRETPDDSIKVANGQFQTTLDVANNTFVTLKSGIDKIPFYADGTPVVVNFTQCTTSGSALNTELGTYTRQLCEYEHKFAVLLVEYGNYYHEENNTEEDKRKMEELEPQLQGLYDVIDSIKTTIFDTNKTNLIGAAYLSDVMEDFEYEKLHDVLSADNELTHHPLAEPAKLLLDQLSKRAPGTQYTDLTENDLNGVPHKLSEWVGKSNYVMLDFWASWCGPCCAEMPNVLANYTKYHSKGFEVIGLSFDSKLEQWQKAIDKLQLPWIQLSDLKGWKTIASSTYNINSIPASILIDPTGKIVAIDLRGEKLGEKLKEIYGE